MGDRPVSRSGIARRAFLQLSSESATSTSSPWRPTTTRRPSTVTAAPSTDADWAHPSTPASTMAPAEATHGGNRAGVLVSAVEEAEEDRVGAGAERPGDRTTTTTATATATADRDEHCRGQDHRPGAPCGHPRPPSRRSRRPQLPGQASGWRQSCRPWRRGARTACGGVGRARRAHVDPRSTAARRRCARASPRARRRRRPPARLPARARRAPPAPRGRRRGARPRAGRG